MALRKVDLQSMFFASMFVVVLVVLAYLTNPSETSFRTYLTEQSFRQHLRRLDDDNQDESDDGEDNGVHYTLARRSTPSASTPGRTYSDSGSPFHFVNRASVSLRTPKHVFHSFGIFTVAAIVPNGSRSDGVKADGSGPRVSDSWYLGAFGKWWRGGYMQCWWLETIANTKDAERCNSGILDLKTLDSLECYDGLPYPAPALPPHLTNKESTSKLRDSARSGHRTANSSARSSTPPPLPKGASLPLHAPRPPTTPSKSDKAVAPRHSPPTLQAPTTNAAPVVNVNAPVLSPQLQSSPSSLFDQSPVISDILRQISASNTVVCELRTQLTEFHSAANKSHSAIQNDLETHRERKRTEDASRNELKTRTKTLEDSKRSAEAVKREAEKKLKAAESARSNASERIERLDKEILQLRDRMNEDERAIETIASESTKTETEIQNELELKRKEIKVAEDVVAALNTRAKELEEKIAAEEERLKKAKEQAELRRQDRAFYPLHVVHSQQASPTMSPWSPISAATPESLPSVPVQDPHAIIHTDRSAHIDVFPQALQIPHAHPRVGTRSRDGSGSSGNSGPVDFIASASPRPRKLSLGIISNFREHSRSNGSVANVDNTLVTHAVGTQIGIRPPPSGFPMFDDGMSAHGPTRSTRFSPFGDNEVEVPPMVIHDIGAPSPMSTSLIPTSLIQSLEVSSGVEDLSRSFQSDSDDFLERDWRKVHSFPAHPVVDSPGFSSSPTSLNHPGFDGVDREDPFEIRPPPPLRHRITAESLDMHALMFPHPNRTSSDPQPLVRSRTRESEEEKAGGGHRRWFSSSPKDHHKEKKGLNPEAKVFQLKKSPSPLATGNIISALERPEQYDVVSPPVPSMPSVPPASHISTHSHPLPPPPSSSTNMDSIFSTLSMRAFAPSPAEREALTRALGSSTNTSLERLPTLSEVSIASSMPSSPSHAHATQRSPPIPKAHHRDHQHQHTAAAAMAGMEGGVGMLAAAVNGRSGLPPGLAWLQSLPRMRKPKFSPWDDEEPTSTATGTMNLNGQQHTNF
ncbi:unnamed protein product [Somion occarium]